MIKSILLLGLSLVAFAAPQAVLAQEDKAKPEGPYKNILVIFLSDSFDVRRYLETEIVKKIEEGGSKATRSTSMMNTKVPVVPETFIAMVEELDADAVLVTQLADLQTKGTVVDMSPQATYNFRPTWYYNVWSVELTEYVAPQAMNLDHKLALATQLYSVQQEKAVWAMESESNIHTAFDQGPDYSVFVDEADKIVKELRKSKMIER
jgi:hypothetical protein